ncbi:MAG TPA: FAD-dependent oxidoreductase, partial [Thermoplasmata archaeon]
MSLADVVVLGAGVVGLAVARELASRGRSVVVVERHDAPGTEQSTHNSQVVHSGIFVRPGTLRARLNLDGAPLLFAAAERWGVPFDRSGTLVVAGHPDDVPRLRRYEAWGRENGVAGVERLSPEGALRIEPRLGLCHEALWSPNGGRIDAGRLVAALEREGERSGVELRRRFEVLSAERSSVGWTVRSGSGEHVEGRFVVNSAGVESANVARRFGSARYRIYPCLGEYARVTNEKREWVRSMIYGFPPPGYPGIGVHLTRRLSGELWLGPTATYLDGLGRPDAPRTPLSEFLREAEPYLPGLTLSDLEPAGAGIRAKVVPPGSAEPFDDYTIEEDPPGSGVLQLIGIESPGLTACLSVGR